MRHCWRAKRSYAELARVVAYAQAIRPDVAYLIVSHTAPELVSRLVDRLLRGDESCFVAVAHDANGPRLTLAPSPRLHVVSEPRAGGWGGYGVVHSTLGAFEWISRRIDPAWVVLLSGQDYPARSPQATREALLAGDADAYVTVEREVPRRPGTPDELWWHARYFYRWRNLPGFPWRLPSQLALRRRHLQYRLSIAQRLFFLWTLPRGLGTALGTRRPDPPFDAGYPCWVGSQWLAASRKALQVLFSEIGRRPELARAYQHTILPDESFIQTVLINSPQVTIAQPNLTYQRWSGPDNAHAANLDIGDLDAIRHSGRAFARKMHPAVSASLMDALDRDTGLVAA
jgi:hypothetical protein